MPAADPVATLRLPTTPVVVEVALVGRMPEEVVLHLAVSPDQPMHAGALIDLLEQHEPFLPAQPIDDRRFVFLRREAVARVSLARSTAATAGELLDEEELFDVDAGVRIELDGGEAVEGRLLFTGAPGRERVSDHLNAPGRFLRVYTPDRLHLVHKHHVARIVELDVEGPSPEGGGGRPRVELVREED